MRLKLSLLTLTLIFVGAISAQDTSQFLNKCTISSGWGYANGAGSSKSGFTFFVQMDYRFSAKFSLATEFEHLNFDLPGYYQDSVIGPNDQQLFDNYFSVLIKYHLPFNSRFRVSLGSGWTYYIRQTGYFDVYTDAYSQVITYRLSSFSGYGIPFLFETYYPLWRNLSVGLRAKYNLNEYANSYSAAIGASLKL
ncbi:MAG TPA: outer membrane beta-barrel protein [Chitinophagaceae bacterium]|jgi:outer membrane protein with beta-barrel domain|nr:outer membrane beta-barrel protein [Chitinophagaceae bacterium]